MKKDLAPQEVQVTQNSTQQKIIAFVCLTFFPLVYFIGKTMVALM